MIDFSVPLAGLERASAALDQTARRLAGASLPIADTPTGAPVDAVDLSAEIVGLIQAKNAYSANIKVLQALDDAQKSTLNILA